MKLRVSELSGALLDAAVAQAEGWKFGTPQERPNPHGGPSWLLYPVSRPGAATLGAAGLISRSWGGSVPAYSAEWDDGGPIIERERITVSPDKHGGAADAWDAWGTAGIATGPTPLIAAMRAYVASKFGDEVELPPYPCPACGLLKDGSGFLCAYCDRAARIQSEEDRKL